MQYSKTRHKSQKNRRGICFIPLDVVISGIHTVHGHISYLLNQPKHKSQTTSGQRYCTNKPLKIRHISSNKNILAFFFLNYILLYPHDLFLIKLLLVGLGFLSLTNLENPQLCFSPSQSLLRTMAICDANNSAKNARAI